MPIIIVSLLFVATVVGILAKRLRMPYTVGLVLVGLALALFGRINVPITPEIILGLLVPPLIYEAAFHLRFENLRRDLPMIISLAIPGVIITMFIVGGLVSWGTGLALNVSLIFGALVSATDPVAVIALFRSLGVPKRLQVLLEGESLFNDGTAIVIFNIVLMTVLTGKFDIIEGLADFIRVSGGGLIVGALLGILISQIFTRIDDHLIETTLTTVLAYGAYILAENFHVSGILAVVAAGLISGNIGPQGLSPTSRIVIFNFWEYTAFLANSFIFLLIGLTIDLKIVFSNWVAILWAIFAVLLARFVVVYGFSLMKRDLSMRWQHILYWGGLRGTISLALAISITPELGPSKSILEVMTFGVVLFTILIQGITMGKIVIKMGLNQRTSTQIDFELRQARAVSARAGFDRLQVMNKHGLLSDHIWEALSPHLKKHALLLADDVAIAYQADAKVEENELRNARREALRTQRSVYSNLLSEGVISEESFAKLIGEIDSALADEETNWAELLKHKKDADIPVTKMMTVVIDETDLHKTIDTLNNNNIPVFPFQSGSDLPGTKSYTLLIGVREGRLVNTVRLLKSTCGDRLKSFSEVLSRIAPFSANNLDSENDPIFVYNLERFEEI